MSWRVLPDTKKKTKKNVFAAILKFSTMVLGCQQYNRIKEFATPSVCIAKVKTLSKLKFHRHWSKQKSFDWYSGEHTQPQMQIMEKSWWGLTLPFQEDLQKNTKEKTT